MAAEPRAVSLRQRQAALVALALLAGSLLVTVLAFQPPSPRPASTPADAFSAERAMSHVRAVAQRPHPVGSPEHARVRDYITAELTRLGLEPEIQRASSVTELLLPFGTTYHSAAALQNIVARLPGRANTKALLLMAHYDSVSTSPGASDDGCGVATLLETARALRASGQPLANDVIFLFTDGEEAGLLGARAFFNQHPLSSQVGTVLNFEARGGGGLVLMFETGPKSGWLIPELASAVPYTFSSSLFSEMYRYLPNETDFTISKLAGIPGLNFAYIDKITTYHSALDRPENVDQRSLQHHGEYALRLARRLGERDLSRVESAEEPIFFNIVGSVFVYYPVGWSVPLCAVAVALWLGALAWGRRNGHLRVRGVVWGALAILLNLLLIAAAVTGLVLLASNTHGEFRRIGDTYNSELYLVGILALTAAAMAALVSLLRRSLGVYHLAAGASLWWVLLAVPTSIFLPGGSFLFTWPLACAALGLGLLLGTADSQPAAWRLLAALSLSAVPPVLIFAPIIYLLFVGLTLSLSPLAAFMAGLLLGLMVPHLHEVTAERRWLFPAVAGAVSLAFVAAASYPAAPDAMRPRQSNVIYALDADSGRAIWASSDQRIEGWTRRFFAEDMRAGRLPDFMPQWPRDFWYGPAPRISASPPLLEVLADTASADRRTVRARIASSRGARSAVVFVSGVPVLAYAVAGMPGPNELYARAAAELPMGERPDWDLWLEGLTARGMEVSLTVPAGKAFTVHVMDRSDGIPEPPGFPVPEWPRDTVPAASLDVENWGCSTYISRAFTMAVQSDASWQGGEGAAPPQVSTPLH
jgi:hypothetical protein